MIPKELIHTMVVVHYRQQSGNYQWYEWKMRAVYLGRNERTDEEEFSLRPLFGTTHIRAEDVISVTGCDKGGPVAPYRV